MTAFPTHPADLAWPTTDWPQRAPEADVDHAALAGALREIADTPPELGVSLATLAIHRGRLVAEQYGPGTDADTTLISWSMAKSITEAVVGMLVGDGLVDIDAPADAPEFAGTDKARITLRNLFAMQSGLEFVEDYVDDSVSHCLEMLFGAGMADHAHYAAIQHLLHEPGTVWNYSSGSTNIISRLAGARIGAAAGVDVGESTENAMRDFLHERLFGPLGMSTASPGFDAAGTFVGSSYVHASARDFARFGYLFLRDGVWDGARLLPQGWVDYSRAVVAVEDDPPYFGYGAHWWIWRDQPGSLAAHGYEGQYIIVVPERDLVVVHLGKIPADVRAPLFPKLTKLIDAFPTGISSGPDSTLED